MLQDFTLGDVEEALRLVHLEQRHLLGMLSGYLDAVLRADDLKRPREAARALLDRLDDSLDEQAAYGSIHETAQRDSLMARQKLLGWLEQQIAELCQELGTLPSCPRWTACRQRSSRESTLCCWFWWTPSSRATPQRGAPGDAIDC